MTVFVTPCTLGIARIRVEPRLAGEPERPRERRTSAGASSPSLFRIPIRARWSASCDRLEHSCRKSKCAIPRSRSSPRYRPILEEDTRARLELNEIEPGEPGLESASNVYYTGRYGGRTQNRRERAVNGLITRRTSSLVLRSGALSDR